jgi:uncharacterized repeat protein (TIGR01451 family)/LPXTG-motif cell wall-anchored protein
MGLPRGSLRIQLGAGAVAAVAAVSSLGLAGVASAADTAKTGADLDVGVVSTGVVKDAAKPFLVRVHNSGPEAAIGVVVTIDASDLNTKKLAVQLPGFESGCSPDGATKVSCVLPNVPAGGTDNGIDIGGHGSGIHAVFIESIGGTGAAGSITVSVTSQTPDPDQTNNTVTTPVSVEKSGIDMVAFAQDAYASLDSKEPITPGKTGEFQWLLFNFGPKPVKGVSYVIALPRYLTFADPPKKGCRYESDDSVEVCSFDKVVVAPGGAISDRKHGQLTTTRVKAAANAPGPVVFEDGVVVGAGLTQVDPAAKQPLAATADDDVTVLSAADAAALKKGADKKANKERDPGDNFVLFSAFFGASTADLGVTATPVTGHVGDTATTTIAVSNAGPSDAAKTTVKVTAPSGTEIVSAETACKATTAGKEYACDWGVVPAGGKRSSVFKLKILSAAVTDGKAVVSSTAKDKKPGNNTAPIKVTVLTGSTGPSAPPAGGTGGGLPVTGSQAAVFGGLGLGAIAIGAVLLVLARRRRELLVPPTD